MHATINKEVCLFSVVFVICLFVCLFVCPPPGYPPGWPTAPYYKESAAGAACRLGQPAETRPMGTATGAAAVEAVGAATAAGVAGAGAVATAAAVAAVAGAAAGASSGAGVEAGGGRPSDKEWRAMSKRKRKHWRHNQG